MTDTNTTNLEIPSPDQVLQQRRDAHATQVEPLVAKCLTAIQNRWVDGRCIKVPMPELHREVSEAVINRFKGTEWTLVYYPRRLWRISPVMRVSRKRYASCE